MASVIADWKTGRRQQVLWIDFEHYARRVFAADAQDWYRNPVRFADTLSQALRVVRSEVLAIDGLASFMEAWKPASGEDEASLPLRLIDHLTQRSEPLAFVSEVADALQHAVGARADLVLKLSSPRDLLLAAGASDETAADFTVLDDVSTALVGLIRGLSGKRFSGLELSTFAPVDLSVDEKDAYAPILSTAEYYGWTTCISYANEALQTPPRCEASIALFPELPMAKLRASGDRRHGGGLTAAFWLGKAGAPPRDWELLHGRIPAEANPEAVAESVRKIA